MGSTIHPSCTAGRPGGGRVREGEGGDWDSRQPVRVLVAGSVPEGVSRVLQDATFVAVSLRPPQFYLSHVSVRMEIFTLCRFVFERCESAILKDNPWGIVT